MNMAEVFAKYDSNQSEDQIEQQIKQSMSYYRCALMEVETKFKVLSENFSILADRNPIESIHTRIKKEESIVKKLERRNLPLSVSSMETNLFDIAGVRIICSFEEDIYNLAHLFLKQDDVRLIEKKDYIQNAKPNGYRSLHLIIEIPIFLANEKKWVKVEVQFRTIAMDFWASLEHKIRYKKDLPQERLNEIDNELYICSKICQELDRKMQQIKDGK
ncbi:GTP pyrophosphokinase [Floccifex sp.]|uniref:GTP pyrophosphokinase n=1 Tax=Floccifex sp. TaxID=2815810 RepID=UPI002A760383|nr:GTP pyrophosphokinase family protein [Floccifex sp.]MDD7280578.1 GTP pyrophosphokinase family protein [Erysipelotrichaceae bacterium]MDY2958645.1 GTP pyrophosphokinase family protein [Floccifex sp.]